jgi:hypothetical protein
LKSVARFSYLYSRQFISSIQAMESIEACEQVPWSPGQNSCSRLVVMQKTNNVQSSDGLMDGVSEQDSKVTLFLAYTNMARGLVIRLASTGAPAYQQAMALMS